jgi:DNA-binding SARP family transcriptional activator
VVHAIAHSSQLHLTMLGCFALILYGRVVLDDAWPRQRARSLLKLLALAPDHRLHREQVAELLWPQTEPATAHNLLRKNIHYLRARVRYHCPRLEIIEREAGMLTLNEQVEVDVDRFRTTARRALAGHGAARDFEEALGHYTGDLLPADCYESWAGSIAEELRFLRDELLAELARLSLRTGDAARAASCLEQLIANDPLREHAHHDLMLAYAALGKRGLALRQFDRWSEIAQRTFGVGPSETTRRVRHEIALQ